WNQRYFPPIEEGRSMSAQNGPGSQGPNRPGPWRPQPPQVQAPVNPSPPPAQAMPQSGQVPPQQVPPQQSDERFRPRPQQQGRPPTPGGPPMQGQPPLQGQPPVQGQPPMQWQPPVPARVYAQPRFAPTVTQEMRMRAGMQAPPQMVTETPWTGAVRQSQPQTEPGSTENIIRLAIGIVVLVALFGGLLLMALLGGLSFGLRLFALIGLSAVPLIGIIAYVLWLDRWKPQPKILLGICLLWGAVAAVILTLVFSLFSDIALYMVGIDGVPSIIGAVFQAPVVEESTKTVLLVVIVLAARRYFEGPLDGLVYGALIGAGFAFTENILYLGGAWNENQFEGLIEIFILRCLCAPLLHTAFSTCAGVTIGFAARKWPWWSLILMWLPGLVFGMALHSFWNGTMALLGAFPEIVNRIGLIVLSRSEEHTSELQSRFDLVCRLLLYPPPPHTSTLSLHDALPIFLDLRRRDHRLRRTQMAVVVADPDVAARSRLRHGAAQLLERHDGPARGLPRDRQSDRSHRPQ